MKYLGKSKENTFKTRPTIKITYLSYSSFLTLPHYDIYHSLLSTAASATTNVPPVTNTPQLKSPRGRRLGIIFTNIDGITDKSDELTEIVTCDSCHSNKADHGH